MLNVKCPSEPGVLAPSPFASLQKHRHSRESGNPDERRELCFSSPPLLRFYGRNLNCPTSFCKVVAIELISLAALADSSAAAVFCCVTVSICVNPILT